MEKELVQFILDEYRVSIKSKTILSIDNMTCKKNEFGEFLFDEVISNNDEALTNFAKNYKSDKDKKNFYNEVFDKLHSKVRRNLSEQFKTDLIPESKPIVDYIPIVNSETNDTILINPMTKQISEMSYEVWMRSLSKEMKSAIAGEERVGKFVYDPYDISTLNLIQFENYELIKVNLYNPPPWRNRANVESECPEKIYKLLKHLFPNEDVLEYILDWLYYALVARNEAYLVLNGAKGIGKGVFCSLVKAMVGFNNYTEAPDSFLESNFNSALDNKRVILLDEFRVDKSKHSKLKRYINKFQNIEKKGKDADRAVEIYNSYIISNNDLSDMYLEFDDRRFSVVDLTTIPLTKTLKTKTISQMTTEEFEDPNSDMVRDFGYFIFNRGAKKYNQFSVYKGERYHQLVENSLKMWQKYLLEEILKGEEDTIDIREFSRKITIKDARVKVPSRVEKFQDFLTNYRYNGEQFLGTVINEHGDWVIKVDPSILKVNEIEYDSDGDLL